MTEVAEFADIQQEFMARIERVVWCNVATVDRIGRPRSRILHPVWDGPTGWIATRRNSLKSKHLRHNSYVSLAYVGDVAKPVYVDCHAAWDDSPEAKKFVWDLCLRTPPPLGYDPEPIFKAVDHPDYGVLRLTPWRLELSQFPSPPLIWRPELY